MARGRRILTFALLLAAGAGLLRFTMGGGDPYPDLSGPPLLSEGALERVLSYSEPIGNVAVAADGQVYFTAHPEGRPRGPKLLRVQGDEAVAWPDEATQQNLIAPLGLRVAGDRLWVIDHGQHGLLGARLLCFDLGSGALLREYSLPSDLAPIGSMLQDLVLSPDGQTAYIADIGALPRRPAVVVLDLNSGEGRRVLERHPCLMPQDLRVRAPQRELVYFGGLVTLKLGLDGIGLTQDGRWLMLAAMANDTLCRVPAEAVLDPALSAEDLASQVQEVGSKPLNDGITTDAAGNTLIGDVEHNSVVRIAPDGARETLLRTPSLRWVDGLSFGPEGWLYIADSDLPDAMLQSHAHIDAHAPYQIWRFRPDPVAAAEP